MRSRERPIARERALARAGALQHAPQLAPERDPEVERRPDALGGHRQAMARGVAREEHAVLDGRTQPVRDPVALVAVRRQPEIAGERHGRLPDAVVRVERADAHPQLAGRRERPAVARADHALVDPHLEVLAGAAGVDLQPAREARVRRLDQRPAQHPLPAERVDDQGGRDVAAVGVHHVPRPRRRPSRSRTRFLRRAAPTAGRRARGSRTSRTSSRAASARSRAGCGRAGSRTSAGSTARGPGCAATRSAPRTRRSGAPRSRSGRGPVRARRCARSSRAIVSPANEAPQIRTSNSPARGVRSAPRLVARMGIGRPGS